MISKTSVVPFNSNKVRTTGTSDQRMTVSLTVMSNPVFIHALKRIESFIAEGQSMPTIQDIDECLNRLFKICNAVSEVHAVQRLALAMRPVVNMRSLFEEFDELHEEIQEITRNHLLSHMVIWFETILREMPHFFNFLQIRIGK